MIQPLKPPAPRSKSARRPLPRVTSPQNSNSHATLAWPEPFLDLIYAIVASKYIVCLILLCGVALGVVRLMKMPPIYRASAVALLMSREKPMLDIAIDANSIEASDDRANRSQAGNLMLPPDPTLYTTLITSRGVIDEMWKRHKEGLIGDLSPNDRSEEVYDTLRSMITVNSTEEGLITISVTSEKPEISSIIANELFAECERASKEIERQLILQQAGHLEQTLINAKLRLEETEAELDRFTARYGLVDLQMQAGNKLRSLRELEAQRDSLESDLRELRLSYVEQSPEIQRVKARVVANAEQLQATKESILTGVGDNEYGGLSVSLESMKQRVQFERDLVATLSTKVDVYRIRAEQPTGNLAVIREAQIPLKPAGPSKKKELGIALFLSIFVAFSVAIAKWQMALAMKHSGVQRRVRHIQNQLWRGSQSHSSGLNFPTVSVHEPKLLMPPFADVSVSNKGGLQS